MLRSRPIGSLRQGQIQSELGSVKPGAHTGEHACGGGGEAVDGEAEPVTLG
jgi:hypothetical protein